MDQPKFERLYFKTYLAMIRNSVGTQMFRNFYVRDEHNHEFDAIGGGDNACAFFVSTILLVFEKIKHIHATVKNTIEDLEDSNWQLVTEPESGDIIIWSKKQFADGPHRHIGFYVGNGRAISTSTTEKAVHEHDLHYGGESRAVKHIFRMKNW